MHWAEQTETMVKALAATQKQMWKNWFDLIPGVPSPAAVYSDVANQISEEAAEGFKAWTAESGQVVKDVAERLLTTQNEMPRFLELSLRAWKAIAPKIEPSEDWQTALLNFTDNLREQLLQFPQEMQKAFQDSDELWRLHREQWKGLVQPWAESLRQAPWHVGQASTGNGSALMELTNLYWDAYERTFGRLLESPSLGYTRELNEDLLKGIRRLVGLPPGEFRIPGYTERDLGSGLRRVYATASGTG